MKNSPFLEKIAKTTTRVDGAWQQKQPRGVVKEIEFSPRILPLQGRRQRSGAELKSSRVSAEEKSSSSESFFDPQLLSCFSNPLSQTSSR